MTTVLADLLPALLAATAVGAGLVAGIFVAFSIAVVPALRRLPPAVGISVMQAVNRAILNPLFLVPYLGTAVGAVVLAVVANASPAVLAGAVAYVVGAFVVTGTLNVPLNNELAAADPDDHGAWERFHRRWTRWNHVRSVAALAGAVLLTVA